MSRTLLELKSTAKDEQTPQRDRRSKIDRSQWPQILERRAAGETLSQIARDYDVTPAAISNIVKRAQAATTAVAEEDAPVERSVLTLPPERQDDVTGTPADAESAQASSHEPEVEWSQDDREAVQGSHPVSDSGEPQGETPETTADEAPAASAAIDRSPEAKRLFDAASLCASLVAGGAPEDDIARAAHDVRRALAAIEIAQSKRDANAKRRSTGPAARQAAAAPPNTEPSSTPSRKSESWISQGSAGMDDSGRLRGTVKFFKPEKGFGFITPDNGSKDVFVAKKTLDALGLSRIAQGDRVVFEVGTGSKGPEAKDVKMLED